MRIADFLFQRGAPAVEQPAPAVPERRAASFTSLSDALDGGFGDLDVDNARWWGKLSGDDLTTSAIVRRCVNAIAQPLASLEFVVLDPAGEEQTHDFATVFNKGAPGQALSARVVKEVAFARLEYRGQVFLFMDRGDSGTGPIRSVMPIFRTVKPVVDRDERGMETLLGFRVRTPSGGWTGLLPSEVLWLRYPDPDNPWGALAPWQSAQTAAKLDRMSQGWQEEELRNGNKASAVIYLGDLTAEEHSKAVAQWRRTMTGKRSANRAFLTSGPTQAKVDRLGMTPKEAAYLDTRKMNMEEVCLAFGIDRDIIFGQSTFENKAAAKRALWTDTLLPKLEVVSSEVDRQVLPEPNLEGGWDVSGIEALQENETAKVDRLGVLLTNDTIMIDEARVERGLEPLPGGVGAQTLTAYRRMVELGPATETDSSATAASSPFATVGLPALIAAGVITEQEGRELLGMKGTAPGRPDLAVRSQERRYVSRRGVRTLRTRQAVHGLSAQPQVPMLTATAVAVADVRAAKRDEAAIMRVYDRLERRGVTAVKRLAEKMERAVIRNFQKAARSAGDSTEQRALPGVSEFFDSRFWQAQTREALEAFMTDVWEEGGERTASHVGASYDQYSSAVTKAMLARLDVLAAEVTDTTRSIIESGALQDAAEEGLSVQDTVELLRIHFTDLSSWRAEAIARTETVGGFNAASRKVAVGTGVVQRRTWLATGDNRTRDSHRDINGYTTEGLDDPYPNGLMYPGDPSGPARETVNCRCVELYVLED